VRASLCCTCRLRIICEVIAYRGKSHDLIDNNYNGSNNRHCDQFKIGLCLDSMDLAIAQLGQRENPGDWRRLCDQAQDRLRETIGVTAAEANSEISKVITSISIAVVSLYGNEPMPALATTGLRTKLREIGALA
jgi:hypothetical protein